ncbi:MAG: putative N-acetylmannosamine-6-phosphate 2-epimerase, partial [bacterium]|nr:putative N-acetylmannosamine-6-phosphate 2-epimerase [bacterium]
MNNHKQSLLSKIRGGLIVSCQAEANEPLNSPEILVALAKSAISSGAVAIRAEHPDNLMAMKQSLSVPVIGLLKRKYSNSEIYITPTLADAIAVLNTDVDIVAIDATLRRRPNTEKIAHIVQSLKKRNALIMADISSVAEGRRAAQLGFDLIGTTLSGYTREINRGASEHLPDFELLSQLVGELGHQVPVIAEGRIWTPDQAIEALRLGAFAVVVGSAITRPHHISRRFQEKITAFQQLRKSTAIGVDLGGAKTALASVTAEGLCDHLAVFPTQWKKGTREVAESLIAVIKSVLKKYIDKPQAIGIAASGRVDPKTNIVADGVALANDYLGYPLSDHISDAIGLPVYLENDANAAAFAEFEQLHYPRPNRFALITIGTGIGCGIILNGKLLRGAGNAAELGHICVEKNGLKCGCGRKGCLEMYVSRKKLQEEVFKIVTSDYKHRLH